MFALKKGLPTDQRPRTLVVENAPQSVDCFITLFKKHFYVGPAMPEDGDPGNSANGFGTVVKCSRARSPK